MSKWQYTKGLHDRVTAVWPIYSPMAAGAGAMRD